MYGQQLLSGLSNSSFCFVPVPLSFLNLPAFSYFPSLPGLWVSCSLPRRFLLILLAAAGGSSRGFQTVRWAPSLLPLSAPPSGTLTWA